MRQALSIFALAAFVFSGSAAAQLPERVGDTPVPSLAPIVKKASPAVVNIATRGTLRERARNPLLDDPFFRRFFEGPNAAPRERVFQSAGSGVIVDAKNGYIITNAHVIDNADEITVTLLDDRQIKAQIVGRDRGSDVAVLKVDSKNLTEMPLADSSKAEVGDFVLAIGNPFALNHTVTSGIISALGRSDSSNPESYQDFIQTDAPINPGNSGGALVNLQGQLVGINTAIFSGTGGSIGIGFAIPSNMVKAVMTQLVQFGEVRRGMLGVQLSNNYSPDVAASLGLDSNRGALVSQVVEGGSADKAGVKAGDVITSINGRAIANAADLRNSIGVLRIGEKVEIGLIRDGQPLRVATVIGERNGSDADASAQIHPALEGATLRDANGGAGVLIQSVAEGSPAATMQLRPNDIIIGIGRQRISNIEQLRAAMKGAGSGFAMRLQRGNSLVMLSIG
jgi:Do/DeqQ family serine protease